MTPTLLESRRQFLAYFGTVGLTSTLLPGVLWAKVQEQAPPKITREMLKDAAVVAGIDLTDEQVDSMLDGVNQNLERYEEMRQLPLDNGAPPAIAFVPIAPGIGPAGPAKPLGVSKRAASARPANLEEVAFWPIARLAPLVKSRQVRSVELTEMYLDRLKRYNPTLNCVVTLTEDLAQEQAKQADAEIGTGRYRGPLHGIPWGAKDIIAVRGYPTTWGSAAFKDQMIDHDATVVTLLREAGAVLVAKLATGELAGGDQWFRGRTNNPWDPSEGSSGSSAGPASATAAGLVAFGVGTETSGSILSPSSICGVTGLRPTFGRVSRYGVMTLSWTQDRVGPLCREVEDAAIVLHNIAKPDGLDFSVTDRVFNWDGAVKLKGLRVGYLPDAFDEDGRDEAWKKNDAQALDVLKSLGVTLVPFKLPDLPLRAMSNILGVESAAAFDDSLRAGRDKLMGRGGGGGRGGAGAGGRGGGGRGDGWRRAHFVPAVEYLQAQRVRAIVMRQFAEATAPFDVFVAPYLDLRSLREVPPGSAPPSARMTNFNAANICGYPCAGIPHGFTAKGTPTSITFIGRPYGETPMLMLAKAYQDATKWHLMHPTLAKS